MMEWGDLKRRGSTHYKSGAVEPIDLYKEGGMLRDFALCSIIKYAFRNRTTQGEFTNAPINVEDIRKIIHYAEMLICLEEEEMLICLEEERGKS